MHGALLIALALVGLARSNPLFGGSGGIFDIIDQDSNKIVQQDYPCEVAEQLGCLLCDVNGDDWACGTEGSIQGCPIDQQYACRVSRTMNGAIAEHVVRTCVPYDSCTQDDWKESGHCAPNGNGKRQCERCDYGDLGSKHDCLLIDIPDMTTTEEPTTKEPTTEEPTTKEPTTEEPTTEVLITEEPTTEVLITEEPTTEVLITEEPTTEVLITEEPTTPELIVDPASTTSAPEEGQPRAKSTSGKPSKVQTRTLRKPSETPYEDLTDNFNNLSLSATPTTSQHSVKPLQAGARSRSVPRQCKTVEDIARTLLAENTKNVIVMVGAGLSTPSGIPDFRSPGTGLYDNLRQYRIPVPQAIFDIDYFESHPKPFYALAKELYPSGRYRPNYAHYFIRMLHEKGRLLRVYTQNIDGLERMAGVPPMKIVEAHGTFLTSSCIKCSQSHPSEVVKSAVFNDKVPRCKTNGCNGLVKPNIVFFGEDLPRRFYYYLKDFPQADLLFVMGTSLEVEPFAGIVDAVRFFVPRILFNRDAVGPFRKPQRANDVVAKGDMIRQVRRFVDLLGWSDDMNKLIEQEEVKKGYPVAPYYENSDDDNTSKPPNGKKNGIGAQGNGQNGLSPSSKPLRSPDVTVKKVGNTTMNNNAVGRQRIVASMSGGTAATTWGVRTGGAGVGGSKPPIPPNSQTITPTAAQKAEIVAIKDMMRTNGLKHKSASMSNLLPRLGARKPPVRATAFHAQAKLFRTENTKKDFEEVYFNTTANVCVSEEEESSEEESEEESSSDDE